MGWRLLVEGGVEGEGVCIIVNGVFFFLECFGMLFVMWSVYCLVGSMDWICFVCGWLVCVVWVVCSVGSNVGWRDWCCVWCWNCFGNVL